MNTEEKEIKKLVERAKFNIEADNLKEATDILRKAMKIAKNIGNEELQKKILKNSLNPLAIVPNLN